MLRSLFPRAYCRFLSLPLLGCVADGFDDWLAANGYTPQRPDSSCPCAARVGNPLFCGAKNR
jgi:hypothetical protein